MPRVYIECYGEDGKQVLGNLDGQASIRAINYHRTAAYKRAVAILSQKEQRRKNGLPVIQKIKVVTEKGSVLEEKEAK